MALLNDVYKETLFVEAVALSLVPLSNTGLQASVINPANNLVNDVANAVDPVLDDVLPTAQISELLIPPVATVNGVLLTAAVLDPLTNLLGGDLESPLNFTDILGTGDANLINIVDDIVFNDVVPAAAPVLAAVEDVLGGANLLSGNDLLSGLNLGNLSDPLSVLDIADVLDVGNLLGGDLLGGDLLGGDLLGGDLLSTVSDTLEALVPNALELGLPALQGDIVTQVINAVNPVLSGVLTPVVNVGDLL